MNVYAIQRRKWCARCSGVSFLRESDMVDHYQDVHPGCTETCLVCANMYETVALLAEHHEEGHFGGLPAQAIGVAYDNNPFVDYCIISPEKFQWLQGLGFHPTPEDRARLEESWARNATIAGVIGLAGVAYQYNGPGRVAALIAAAIAAPNVPPPPHVAAPPVGGPPNVADVHINIDDIIEANPPVGEGANLPGDGANLPVGDGANLPVGEEANLPVGDGANLPVGEEANLPVGDGANPPGEEANLPGDLEANNRNRDSNEGTGLVGAIVGLVKKFFGFFKFW